jgi:hypothetical protein
MLLTYDGGHPRSPLHGARKVERNDLYDMVTALPADGLLCGRLQVAAVKSRSRWCQEARVSKTKLSVESAISAFGTEAKAKLSAIAAKGEPEDQLRNPLEQLFGAMVELSGLTRSKLALIGESSLSELHTRPDFAVRYSNALIGFIEVKAPGKGADPRKFKDPHDKAQWKKLAALPNLIYTDGNSFALWRSGDLVGMTQHLDGDIETSGAGLGASAGLLALFNDFFRWTPIPPTSPQQLAQTTAKLCRLLRDEVAEQLNLGDATLAGLASDWRHLLFPDASNAQFADGYAQAVTFGLLLARAQGISLDGGIDTAAKKLSGSNSLIGTALRASSPTTSCRPQSCLLPWPRWDGFLPSWIGPKYPKATQRPGCTSTRSSSRSTTTFCVNRPVPTTRRSRLCNR